MPRTFRQALTAVFEDPQLTKADRDHLERWASEGGTYDEIWRRLAAAAKLHGMLPPNSTYEAIVREALFMRETAKSAQSGIDFNLRERRQYHERHLDLAKKSDELADYYRWAAGYSGMANFFNRFFKPVGELENFHRREAEILRRRAGRPPKSSLRISRQDRSKGHGGLRKINVFIDLADCFIRDWISADPAYEAIAVLTNIAFPGYDLIADDVRKALQPTTREGRKQASRALTAKKS
jgi:hypothetical protein